MRLLGNANEAYQKERFLGHIYYSFINRINSGCSLMKVFLDVSPDGKHYGFPKEMPEELINRFGGLDYELKPGWRKWATEQGYPGVDGKNVQFSHFVKKDLL
jgi:hypothetical protein